MNLTPMQQVSKLYEEACHKAVSAIIVISLILPQMALGKGTGTSMKGGARGLLICSHKNTKTIVQWRIIVANPDRKINHVDFSFLLDGIKRDVAGVLLPPLTDYTRTEIFDGSKPKVIVTGEAYSLSLRGIHRYLLPDNKLEVDCD